MKKQLIEKIEQEMLEILDNTQIEILHRVLEHTMWNIEISSVEKVVFYNKYINDGLLHNFLSTKKIEGCSEKTLRYYKSTLKKMIDKTNFHVMQMTTENLREYLSEYQQINNCSKTNIDNIRRILSSFFSWMEEENYIIKSSMRRIHKIKTSKTVKETYSDEALELLGIIHKI